MGRKSKRPQAAAAAVPSTSAVASDGPETEESGDQPQEELLLLLADSLLRRPDTAEASTDAPIEASPEAPAESERERAARLEEADVLRSRVQELEASLEARSLECLVLQESLSCAEGEVSTLRARCTSLSEHNLILNGSVEELTTALASTSLQCKESLQDANGVLQEENAHLQEEIVHLQSELDKEGFQNEDLSLQKELQSVEDEEKSRELSLLRESCQRTEQALQSSQETVQRLTRELESLSSAASDCPSDGRDLCAEKTHSGKKERGKAEEKGEEEEAEITWLASSQQLLLNRYKNELDLTSYSLEKERLISGNALDQLSTARSDHAELSSEHAQLQGQTESLRCQLRQREKDLQLLREEHQNLQLSLSREQEKNHQLEGKKKASDAALLEEKSKQKSLLEKKEKEDRAACCGLRRRMPAAANAPWPRGRLQVVRRLHEERVVREQQFHVLLLVFRTLRELLERDQTMLERGAREDFFVGDYVSFSQSEQVARVGQFRHLLSVMATLFERV